MISELIFIANEMKQNAEKMIIDPQLLMTVSASEGKMPIFPKELIKEYNGLHIQFSIDKLSQDKIMFHLSYGRIDMSDPSDEEKYELELAFFGKKENLMRFPGSLRPYVYHVAEIKNESV